MPATASKPAPQGGRNGFRLRLAGAIGFALALLAAGELDRLPPPPDRAAFAIVTRTPYAELKFRGLTLKSARQNPGLNEIALDFAGPVDGELFTELERVLPEWVEFAYAGYDSAVIRAKRPAQFSTRMEDNGFSLRIDPRADANPEEAAELAADRARLAAAQGSPAAAREELAGLQREDPRNPFVLRTRAGVEASVGDWQAAERYYAMALAERPRDESLARAFEEARRQAGPHIGVTSEWRHVSNGETIIAVTGSASVPVAGRFAITGEATSTWARAPQVQRLDGTIAPFSTNVQSGALGASYRFPGGGSVTAEGLYGQSGAGGRLSFLRHTDSNEVEVTATYHAPYTETAEAVADRAEQDRVQLRYAQRIAQGLWGEAALRLTRYGVDVAEDVTRTAGFSASLRYVRNLFGWSAGLAYEAEGEYLLHQTPFAPLGTPFVPLQIRNREVHALSASASAPIAPHFWFDVYGGYAIDRYSNSGPFGGLELRYTPAPGLDISLGASHSAVSGHQGERGATTSAGLTLIYKMPGDTPQGGDE